MVKSFHCGEKSMSECFNQEREKSYFSSQITYKKYWLNLSVKKKSEHWDVTCGFQIEANIYMQKQETMRVFSLH